MVEKLVKKDDIETTIAFLKSKKHLRRQDGWEADFDLAMENIQNLLLIKEFNVVSRRDMYLPNQSANAFLDIFVAASGIVTNPEKPFPHIKLDANNLEALIAVLPILEDAKQNKHHQAMLEIREASIFVALNGRLGELILSLSEEGETLAAAIMRTSGAVDVSADRGVLKLTYYTDDAAAKKYYETMLAANEEAKLVLHGQEGGADANLDVVTVPLSLNVIQYILDNVKPGLVTKTTNGAALVRKELALAGGEQGADKRGKPVEPGGKAN